MATIGIVMAPGSRGGNRITALRWARVLRKLGSSVFVEDGWSGRRCDLMVALHARRTDEDVARFRAERPGAPVIVAGTGTDLYVDLQGDPERARRTLAGFRAASRIVVLQERGVDALPADLRPVARVVHQSLGVKGDCPPARVDVFEVCVLAHLRPVKDPLLAARAVRLLPAGSRIEVTHVGGAADRDLTNRAQREAGDNPRWNWLGARRRLESLRILGRSRLLVSTSIQEGGANAVTEAIALGVGVLATDIPGSTGLLGADHPGLFPVGDAAALADLLARAESDTGFFQTLLDRTRGRQHLTDPSLELESWKSILEELSIGASK